MDGQSGAESETEYIVTQSTFFDRAVACLMSGVEIVIPVQGRHGAIFAACRHGK
jgi:hypothetical protein